jgi:hypothetical protein
MDQKDEFLDIFTNTTKPLAKRDSENDQDTLSLSSCLNCLNSVIESDIPHGLGSSELVQSVQWFHLV